MKFPTTTKSHFKKLHFEKDIKLWVTFSACSPSPPSSSQYLVIDGVRRGEAAAEAAAERGRRDEERDQVHGRPEHEGELARRLEQQRAAGGKDKGVCGERAKAGTPVGRVQLIK